MDEQHKVALDNLVAALAQQDVALREVAGKPTNSVLGVIDTNKEILGGAVSTLRIALGEEPKEEEKSE